MDKKIKLIFDSLNLKINNFEKIDTLANILYKVKTNKGNYFLKFYTSKIESKAGFKLKNLYPLVSKKGVPVPNVLKYDDNLELADYPYLILSEIKGDRLSEVFHKMNDIEKFALLSDLGKIQAKINSITFSEFGEVFEGKNVESFSEANNKGPFKTWKEMHNEIIEFRLNILKGSFFDDLIRSIRKWFLNNSHLIDYDIVPRLLHNDLNKKNIIIEKNKISGIVDFDGAFIGHNEEELMRTEQANFSKNKELKNSFFKSYKKIIDLDEGYESRRKFYYFSRFLVHINCLVEYGDNYVEDVEKEQEILKKEVLNLLAGKSDFD